MGQKLSEHPAVDKWVELAREADKVGAKMPRRRSADPLELEKVAYMNRLRTRAMFSLSHISDAPRQPGPRQCQQCGKFLSKNPEATGGKLRRSILTPKGWVKYYRCGKCVEGKAKEIPNDAA